MNAQMTITYWEIGRRTIYSDQAGAKTVDYGDVHIKRLAKDLSASIAAYWRSHWPACPPPPLAQGRTVGPDHRPLSLRVQQITGHSVLQIFGTRGSVKKVTRSFQGTVTSLAMDGSNSALL